MSYRRILSLAVALLLPVLANASQTQIIPLSGMGEPGEQPVHWDFRIDSGRGAGQWTRIRVPSCWEQEGFGAYYYGTQGRNKPEDDPIIPKERGDYRSEFLVPAQWRGQQVRIVFEAAMTDTTVLVNGQPAGPTHQGGFYRFHYDISSLVKFGGKNRLEVSVSKESANTSVNRAERRGDYWTFGGIYRPVWLEARPRDHIEWTAIDARADGHFYAQVHLENKAPAGSSVRGRILDDQGNAVGSPLTASFDTHGTTAILTGKVPQPRTWSAETPHLYRVQFELLGTNEDTIHAVTERFGFRTFELRPRDGLYLNGRKIVLKGINHHSFAPATGRTLTREQSYTDARLIKAANMNAVRMSHYPPDPHFLEAADELGLYVLDELAGWQGSYDTPTGSRLIGQIVRRDVNHPSILFWDNGNEGGWNREVDGEFDRWDPQRRPVLHPWTLHSGVNTDHYENYESTTKLSNGPDIFMPTEFLHGLYDGGIGAGLRDYWDVMGKSPTVAGGFFWVFADEGIERTDRDGRIDNMGNAAPDGIVGPHGEKEGSYYTVREIWSPVQISALRLDRARSSLQMTLENQYSFTELSKIKFRWRALQLPATGGTLADQRVLAHGEIDGPAFLPGESKEWQLPLQRTVDAGQLIELTASDWTGHELWTWTVNDVQPPAATAKSVTRAQSKDPGVVQSPPYELRFDTSTGRLAEIRKHGRSFSLRDGPRLVAYKRNARAFEEVATPGRLRRLELAKGGVLATATYDGPLRKVTWSRSGDALNLSYEIQYEAPVDVLGVRFDFPERDVTSKRWVGKGPFRAWQNRREGGVFGFHETTYNDAMPGETYAYPEFKGYFDSWRWLTLSTSGERVTVENIGAVPHFGLFQPRVGVNPVMQLPDVGWSFLHVIPAMGTKFEMPEKMGPQSQPRTLRGIQRGELRFDFDSLTEPAESATH